MKDIPRQISRHYRRDVVIGPLDRPLGLRTAPSAHAFLCAAASKRALAGLGHDDHRSVDHIRVREKAFGAPVSDRAPGRPCDAPSMQHGADRAHQDQGQG